jgi:LPS export ABC transporter protein LptC
MIGALLFVVVVVQLLILSPRDLGLPDEGQVTRAALTASGSSQRVDSKKLPRDSSGGQVMRDLHLIEAKPTGKEWELWAEKAVKPKDSPVWTMEAVRVRFFASNGATYVVTGRAGGVHPDRNDIWIRGKVETKSSNGYVFKTESLFYESQTKRLMSKDAVEVLGPQDGEGSRLELNGEDLLAEFTSNRILINKKVRAKKRVAAGQGLTRLAQIQSQRAMLSGQSNSAEFFGSVSIDLDNMRITGPEARFLYDRTQAILESVLIAGGIRVTDSDKFATSGSLAVHFKDDRYVFKGSPRVVQSSDELIGDEIVFLEGGKKVQVINARAQLDPQSAERAQGRPPDRPPDRP